MAEILVWKKTSRQITQLKLSQVINEIERDDNTPPEVIKRQLLDERQLFQTPSARYHIWRDSL